MTQIERAHDDAQSARERVGRRVLLANSACMTLGFYTIVTVTALHFHHGLGFAVASVGLALALRQLTQQGLDLFGGVFADRVGYRFSIALGCVVRALAFACLGLARSLPQLLFACILAGLGGMFFDAAGSGALAALTPRDRRPRMFAIQATLANAGAALGTELGVLIYAHDGYLAAALVAALIFVWIGAQTIIWLPGGTGLSSTAPREGRPMTLGQTMRAIALRRSYIRVALLIMGFWAISAQVTLTVPLAAARMDGQAGVAILLGVNAFLSIPLQYPVVRLAERYFSPLMLLATGTFLTGAGLATIFIAPSLTWQIAGMVIATVGSLAIIPIMATITAKVAPPRAIAAFYGFSAIGIGVGGALGQLIGGTLFDMQGALRQPWLLAAALLAVGVGMAVALARAPDPTTTPVIVDGEAPAQPGVVTASTR